MKKLAHPRVLMLVAALLLVPVFVTPLWTIGLVAPQYSDGLGMHILVNDIRGHDRHDIQNINILNHYIGMQPIVPEEVPELEYMPIILGALLAAGLLAALIGHRWVLAAWLVAFLGLGAAGMVDFYMWKVDYGTNLSPDAPIKVPGMTYKPPLIGTKQLLNITASSYPSWGTLFLTLSAAFGAGAVFTAFRRKADGKKAGRSTAGSPDGAPVPPSGLSGSAGLERDEHAPESETSVLRSSSGTGSGEGSVEAGAPGATGSNESPGRAGASGAGPTIRALVLGLGLLVVVAACGSGADGVAAGSDQAREARTPENSIVYGEDQDPYCQGEVNEVRWGGEIRTRDGERLRFRSVECLAGFLLSGTVEPSRVERVRVVDFADGWRLVDASEALYLHSPLLSSPDKLNLHALATRQMAERLKDAYTGPIIGWDEVLELVEREWAPGREARAGGG